MKTPILAALALVAATTTYAADTAPASYWGRSTWQDPDRGYFWYAPPKAPESEPKPVGKKAREQMSNKELGAEIERLLAIAVETQSQAAVTEYLELQQYALDRASRFSDVFRRTVWANPALDYSLRGRPVNASALAAYDAQRDDRRRAASSRLAKTHGMFFFFRGSCGYCHQLAPVLRLYQRTYGIEIFPVSLDGGTLPEYPDARPDNGAARNLNVTTVPALFLADKRTGALQALGYGVMSLEELVNRVYVLTATEPGQEY